jgi:hypothetical protein
LSTGGVGLPVAAAVEPVAELLAGGGAGRAGAAQRGEAGFLADPAGVVAGGGQQRGGDLGGDALPGQKSRRGGVREEFLERGVQPGDLRGQLLVAAATAPAVSDLPRCRRAWRFGRITPATSTPRLAR